MSFTVALSDKIVFVWMMMAAIIKIWYDTQKSSFPVIERFLHSPAKAAFSVLIDGFQHQED
jgi:hypothetical protein